MYVGFYVVPLFNKMKRKNTILTIALIVLLILTGCHSTNINAKQDTDLMIKEKLTLGYCPTMSDYAKAIKSDNLDIIPFGSTFEILKNLRQEKIDIALVGRIAKENEIAPNYGEIQIGEGLTLITDSKRLIDISELHKIKIATYLSEEKIEMYKDDFLEVIYTENIDQALLSRDKNVILIDWKDFQDDFELLIPIKEGKKIEKYRIPVLYFNKNIQDKAEIIESILKKKTI